MNLTVSVITPVYNSSSTISRVVNSVIAQEVEGLEHIFIDDGSTDCSLDKLKEYKDRFDHIKVFTQENMGAGAARNKGIKEASGKYVAFLDADDEWLESKLCSQIKYMDENSCYFSYGDYSVYNVLEKKYIGGFTLAEELSYKDLLRGCPIGCLTVVYNQEKLGKVYMPDIRRGQDWALWLKLTRNGLIAKKYPGNRAVYNVGLSSLSANKYKKIFDIFKIYKCQEGLGMLASVKYLFLHVFHAIRKRPAK